MTQIKRIVTNPRRGRAVVHNGVVYVGGQTCNDRSGDIRSQTAETLAKLDRVLQEAGSDRTRILSAQIWLKNIAADFAGMNEIWDDWIDPAHAPARATAQCPMGAEDVLVEIVVIAAAKADRGD